MQDTKNRIEAVLFTTGRFMDAEEIAQLCGIGSIGHIKEAIQELQKDYEKRETSLVLVEEEGSYKLTIKKDYNFLTTGLLDQSELDGPTLKTLSLIAYKQPALQSEIIDMRGVGAYDHIKILKDNQFIVSEPKGRTRVLKLAPKFFDYFDLVEGQIVPSLTNEKITQIEQDTKHMEEEVDKIEKTLEEKQHEHEKKKKSEDDTIEVNNEDEEDTIITEEQEKVNE